MGFVFQINLIISIRLLNKTILNFDMKSYFELPGLPGA